MDAARYSRATRALTVVLALGLYLSIRGYQSHDGDQAYRLPLLLHFQDPALYHDDPFVRAIDAFNPHTGYLTLLDAASRIAGLSVGLFGIFALVFAATVASVARLARRCWPSRGEAAGWLAVLLVLAAGAGNIGTNHLFEPVLLDRLIALALGWLALCWMLVDSSEDHDGAGRRSWNAWRGVGPGLLLALAAWIHPAMGLQLAAVLIATLALGLVCPTWLGWGRAEASVGVACLILGQIPTVLRLLGQRDVLLGGLPTDEFRLLALQVQGPQHLVPHLWRVPQWLAWGCYPVLAWTAARSPGGSMVQRRLSVVLGLILVGLGVAAVGIEVQGDLRLTLFQPFRMATLARGLCLVIGSGRILSLWREGGLNGRLRAVSWVVGVTGDWAMVAALVIDLAGAAARRLFPDERSRRAFLFAAAAGCVYALMRHDTQQRAFPLAGALVAMVALHGLRVRWIWPITGRRLLRWSVAAWLVPIAAAVVPHLRLDPRSAPGRLGQAIVEHCRFGETPTDDLERLAEWCRWSTPSDARFIAPPGAKTFRLWSRRSLAFNRAASPYHAAGLADWADRFRRHVDLDGSNAELARAYLKDRRGLERRYDALDAEELAALAASQGAGYVVAGAGREPGGPLVLLKRSGDLGVYRVAGPGGPSPIARSPGTTTAR